MSSILLVRHGSVDVEGRLTDPGKRQIQRTAEFLQGQGLLPESTLLICSRELRALESARIIQRVLGLVGPEIVPCLHVNRYENPANDLKALAEAYPHLQLIAVGHAPQIEKVTQACGCFKRIGNGDIFRVCFDNGTAEQIASFG